MNNSLKFNELSWGMLLICQSGDKSMEFPSDKEIRDAVASGRSTVSAKNVGYVFTESHVNNKEVRVTAEISNIEPKTELANFKLYTSTGKVYIGDIPKTEYTVIENLPEILTVYAEIDEKESWYDIKITLFTGTNTH